MDVRRKVWFHRARALGWALLGAVSFALGWQNSVALVWGASVYANVVSDLGAAEAADDRKVLDHLRRIERLQRGSRSKWPKRLRDQVNKR